MAKKADDGNQLIDESVNLKDITLGQLQTFLRSLIKDDDEDGEWETEQIQAHVNGKFEKTFFYVDAFNILSYVKFMEKQFGNKWSKGSWYYDATETGEMGFYKNAEGKDVEYLRDGYINMEYKGTKFVFKMCFDHEAGAYRPMFFTKENELKKIQPLVEAMETFCNSMEYFKGRVCHFLHGGLQVLKYRSNVKFDDVILQKDLKAKILKNTHYYLENMETLRKEGVDARRGVILSGHPGNGKSLMCKALEAEAPKGTTVFWVTAGSMNRVNQVGTLFNAARKLSPSLVIIEDMDSLVGNRETDGGGALLGEFLTQMDGVNSMDGVVLVATTNYINHIDIALRNRPKRFDRNYEIPLPNKAQRLQLFEIEKKNHKCGVIKESTRDDIVKRSENFSAVFYNELFQTATINKLQRGGKSISDEDLNSAIDEVMTAKKESHATTTFDYT